MLKSLLTKSKALFSVGAIAVIATIAIAAVVLVNGRDQDGNWGSLWGEAEDVTVAELPPEAQQKLKLIKAAAPFLIKTTASGIATATKNCRSSGKAIIVSISSPRRA
mgnify:CR=1 FL=1